MTQEAAPPQKFNVHVYEVMRVSYLVAAGSQADALKLVDAGEGIKTSSAPAEEVTGYIVDEVGDYEYANTREYDPDHQLVERKVEEDQMWAVDCEVSATMYVRAKNPDEARAKAEQIGQIDTTRDVSDLEVNDPNRPDISWSPHMTVNESHWVDTHPM